MKSITEKIQESLNNKISNIMDKIDIDDLKKAYYNSSFMSSDRSYITVDGDVYTKIKKDGWQKESTGAHTLESIYTSEELYNIIKKAKDTDFSNITFK